MVYRDIRDISRDTCDIRDISCDICDISGISCDISCDTCDIRGILCDIRIIRFMRDISCDTHIIYLYYLPRYDLYMYLLDRGLVGDLVRAIDRLLQGFKGGVDFLRQLRDRWNHVDVVDGAEFRKPDLVQERVFHPRH